MLGKLRSRFSSAHLMAGLALFIALGGSAWALQRNSVGTKQLRNGAVKTKKIANGAVKTRKLANDAVTGAKVNELSLGQVPSASVADTATSAGTATTAQSAADATELAGRTLSQVRPTADGQTDSTGQGLDDTLYEATALTEDISIPLGGGDLVVNASVELENNGGGQAGVQCVLRSDGVQISQVQTMTLGSGLASHNMSLTGFADNLAGSGLGDPENVTVFCQGSIADDAVRYEEGDLNIQVFPTGTGS